MLPLTLYSGEFRHVALLGIYECNGINPTDTHAQLCKLVATSNNSKNFASLFLHIYATSNR